VGLKGRSAWLAFAIGLTALLASPAAASAGPSSSSGYAPLAGGHKYPRTKIRTDGLLTVGGQETLAVSHVPRRRQERLSAMISPPITAQNCFVEPPIEFDLFSTCLSQPLYPVAGTPTLKRSKKGRGSLTFIMPPAYEYIDVHDPTQSHPIYLVDNQTVFVDLWVISHPDRRSTEGEGLASASAVVQVPPGPTP
jgi:hypothetical protein